jgi:hypothetical protein
MDKRLSKYKAGLAVLMVLALALVAVVLVQASATKVDTKTNNTASSIADTLNNYVDTNNVIPATLAGAGVKSVPSTISYQKLSDGSYKFCVTYKGNSSGFNAGGVATDLLSGQLGAGAGDSSGNTDLTIDATYHKGANCQTVQPSYITTPSPQPCLGVKTALCVNPTPQGSTTLCGYGPVQANSCSLRCSTSNSSIKAATTPKIIDGTVSTVTGSSTGLTLTISDAKNATHQVSVNSSTSFYDSSCDPVDSSTIQTGDQVRITVDAAVTYPGGTDSHVMASEIDDLSY